MGEAPFFIGWEIIRIVNNIFIVDIIFQPLLPL